MARVRTKTVKRASRKLVEAHYSKFTTKFEDNKVAIVQGKLAKIATKRLRNKIAGYTTRIMVRLTKGPVRGVNLKLQEEERERRDNYVPEKSYFEMAQIQQSVETADMLKAIGFAKFIKEQKK
ncbi:Ribosomal_protein S17 [Hexamita inflata]|uniref:Ribosomal protein S17 n=1 Tax=Hexamita inflata TaxID=28002 RepID=A0AA86PVH7_9EUKA|nr:Ribosomal protein S17 [Hexamita inflata]CAI9938389.1 Ribosomal protein S17 [Hexamita inflata]CAI9947024.1 Ribosomal protein S17 [Hexamita inflata]